VLEAMEEHQVTVFGTLWLDPPYIVLRTKRSTWKAPIHCGSAMDRLSQGGDGIAKPDEAARNSDRTTGTAQKRIQPLFGRRKPRSQIEDLKALVRG